MGLSAWWAMSKGTKVHCCNRVKWDRGIFTTSRHRIDLSKCYKLPRCSVCHAITPHDVSGLIDINSGPEKSLPAPGIGHWHDGGAPHLTHCPPAHRVTDVYIAGLRAPAELFSVLHENPVLYWLCQQSFLYNVVWDCVRRLSSVHVAISLYLNRFLFSLTWDPMGAKVSKYYSSYKSQAKDLKLLLNFPPSGLIFNELFIRKISNSPL